MRFDELDFLPELMDGLDAMNFQEMTPVQEKAIPEILQHKDIIACAQTGTGKTAAYLLPLINMLMDEEPSSSKVRAIVMAPTRELAQQIDQQLEGFSYFVPVTSVAVYGGSDASAWDVQKQAIQNGTDIVIATPGRLISHIKMGNVDFSGVKYFILDEADRMLDMGFFDDIMAIASELPKERQTIMFSATMPVKIKKLAEGILRDPAFVNVAISKPAEGIEQSAYVCYEPQKVGILKHLLATTEAEKVIIFSSSKLKVKEMYRTLLRQGIKIGAMHSDLEQADRDNVMLDYKSGKLNVLIATDIVARGIDIEGIELVINYDVPHDAEDYIHRIGRTARANRQGKGVTFVSEDDQYKFKLIEDFLEKEITKALVPEELGETPAYSPSRKRSGRGGNSRGGSRPRSNGQRQNRGGEQRTTNAPRPHSHHQHSNNEAANGSNDTPRSNRPRRHHRPNRNKPQGGNGSAPTSNE